MDPLLWPRWVPSARAEPRLPSEPRPSLAGAGTGGEGDIRAPQARSSEASSCCWWGAAFPVCVEGAEIPLGFCLVPSNSQMLPWQFVSAETFHKDANPRVDHSVLALKLMRGSSMGSSGGNHQEDERAAWRSEQIWGWFGVKLPQRLPELRLELKNDGQRGANQAGVGLEPCHTSCWLQSVICSGDLSVGALGRAERLGLCGWGGTQGPKLHLQEAASRAELCQGGGKHPEPLGCCVRSCFLTEPDLSFLRISLWTS